jgi:hypothetical protein
MKSLVAQLISLLSVASNVNFVKGFFARLCLPGNDYLTSSETIIALPAKQSRVDMAGQVVPYLRLST